MNKDLKSVEKLLLETILDQGKMYEPVKFKGNILHYQDEMVITPSYHNDITPTRTAIKTILQENGLSDIYKIETKRIYNGGSIHIIKRASNVNLNRK